ncbi:MAG: hypothetical protein E6Q95_03275 [Chitinophagaceae bacterium]|nr:MAG: hypothetical protein E6Q95_03275 [Chitinophagaceae bacterium]
MQWLIFLSRVGIVSGIFMCITILTHLVFKLSMPEWLSKLLLSCFSMSLYILPILMLIYITMYIINKKKLITIPKKLLIANLIFFVVFLLFVM